MSDYPAVDDYEAIEARRLAEAVDALEAGADPGIDPREDPELSAQIKTVSALRELHHEATQQPSFAAYIRRSGAFIKQQLRREHAPQPVAERPVPFFFRWSVLTPVASAAAAAAIILAIVTLNPASPDAQPELAASEASPPDPRDGTLPLVAPTVDPVLTMLEQMAHAESLVGEQQPLATRSAEDELRQIRATLDEIASLTERGELVAESVLHELTVSTAILARRIAATPQSVTRETVIGYIETAGEGQTVLGDAEAARGSEDALHAARLATQDGVVVAALYLFRSQVPVAPSE